MPLIKIPNQPLFEDPNRINEPYCGDDYCHLFLSNDPLYVQFYQTPCGLNETCDEDFTDITLGSELAPSLCAGPPTIILGATWTCAAGPIFTKTTSVADESVNFTGLGLFQYSTYKITFTIANRTQGGVYVAIGGSPTASTSNWFTDNGTYTVYLTMQSAVPANDDFFVVASGSAYSGSVPDQAEAAFLGDVQDISIKEVISNCWNVSTGSWDIDGLGGACKTETGTGVLIDDVGGTTLLANTYYELEVVISNYVSGTLTPTIGGTPSDDISGNGTFKRYATSGGAAGNVTFTPSSDFIGCVETVDIRALKNDYTMTVVDAVSLNEIEDVSSYLTYYNEYVTFCMQPQNIELPEGCYRLYMFDQCDLQYGEFVFNGSFIGGSGETCPNWSPLTGVATQRNFDGNVSPTSYQLFWDSTQFAWTKDFGLLNDLNVNLEPGNYRISCNIVANSDVVNDGIAIYFDQQQTPSPPTWKTLGTHSYDIAATFDTDDILTKRLFIGARFNPPSDPSTGTIEVTDVSVVKLAPYSATYQSECFKVVAEAPKTKLFVGTSNNNAYGFEFANSGFKLSQRLECRGYAPKWNTARDTYTFTTGNANLNYSEIEKYFTLFIEACPSSCHGALVVQANCDNFSIVDVESEEKYYFVEDDGYTPLWDRSGASELAPATLSIKIRDEGTLFKRSC